MRPAAESAVCSASAKLIAYNGPGQKPDEPSSPKISAALLREALLPETESETNAPVGYAELIRSNANFRFLWFGQIISLLGDWFNLIASAALVATLTQSGFAVGSLFVVRMLAPFLTSPIAGVIADRYSRKHILIVADIARAVTVFGFLLVRRAELVWLLYTLTAIQLGIGGFFFTARNAILPDLVSRRALGAANAISSATWSVMLAVGAALGGLVSGTLGIYPAFVIDGLTFLLSAAFIARISLEAAPRPALSEKTVRRAFQEYADGLRYLRRHLDVLVIALHKAALTVFLGSTFRVVQVAIGEHVFVVGKGGGISVGLMFAVAGVGTGIGPLVTRRFIGDRHWPLRLAILAGYLAGAVGLFVTAPLVSLPVVLLGALLSGVGNGILWVFSTQLLMHLVPGHIRGRVFSTEFAFFTLTSAAGAAAVGWAIDTPLGIGGVVDWMARLVFVPAALWGLWLMVGKRSSED